VWFVNRAVVLPVLTLSCAVALALMLAGCGLKGPLDKPPSEAAPAAQLEGQPGAPPPPEEGTAPPPRKRFFLDVLLD
jgi:predicted small lipoprotein YifL